MMSAAGSTEIRFDPSFQPGKFLLMELDEHLLSELGLDGNEHDEFDDLLSAK